jgi:hypothetical protein
MAGKPGQVRRKPIETTVREKAWVTIRKYYPAGFTLRDLLVVIEEAKSSNLDRWIRAMRAHGYFSVVGRVVRGSHARYRLVRDETSHHPVVCSACGEPIMRVAVCAGAQGPEGGASDD